MESHTKTIKDVLEDLSFIATLPLFQDLTPQHKSVLEFLYKDSNAQGSLTQKNYATAKTLVIKKLVSDWIGHDQNTQINFQELISVISTEIKSCNDSKQKLVWDKCFSETYKAYEPYQKLESHQDKIKEMLISKEIIEDTENIDIKANLAKGVNESYIVTDVDKQVKFYIKTFSNDSRLEAKGKIDPCEALVYKIMEYIELGPKTYFLIKSGSSSGGSSSIYAGNYIVTEDLANDEKVFMLDSVSNIEKFHQIYKEENFALNMQVASAVRDILSIWDTFNVNPSNYGMLIDSKNSEEYGIKFVDHLPNATNGFFSKINDGIKSIQGYSPRLRLQEEAQEQKKDMSPLIECAFASRECYNKESLKIKLITRMLEENDLSKAVKRAKLDVEELIEEYGVNFVDHANIKLNTYVAKICQNIDTFNLAINDSSIDSSLFNVPHTQPSIIEEFKTGADESVLAGNLENTDEF